MHRNFAPEINKVLRERAKNRFQKKIKKKLIKNLEVSKI